MSNWMTLTPAQEFNLKEIFAQGIEDGITDRGLAIAAATVCVESYVYVLASTRPGQQESQRYPHDRTVLCDADSIGLFQQREAWAPYSSPFYDRMNQRATAHQFFCGGHEGQRGLKAFDYNSLSRTEGQWAQAVQVSAFPDRYEDWVDQAWAWVHQYVPALRQPPKAISVPAPVFNDGHPSVSVEQLEDLIAKADGQPHRSIAIVYRAAAKKGCGNPMAKMVTGGVVNKADQRFARAVIREVQRKRRVKQGAHIPVNGKLSVYDLTWLSKTRGARFHVIP